MPCGRCIRPIAARLYVALTGPLRVTPAADANAMAAPAAGADAALKKSAGACRSGLKTFSQQMAKGGYWVADDGDGLGYPVGAAG